MAGKNISGCTMEAKKEVHTFGRASEELNMVGGF